VTASFWAGHPGNVFHTSPPNTLDTFFSIQRKASNGTWVTVRTDADWDTTFKWEETQFSGAATIEWVIPANAQIGTYRILHRGYSGDLLGVEAYEGATSEFELW
jgi:neutral ceramidase